MRLLLNDKTVMSAVSGILQRSEKQTDVNKLVGSYVDTGILPQLLNRNSQIIYGRRGTGKTHVFKVLVAKLSIAGNAVCYIDARTLGSTAQFTDTSLTVRQRCTSLFRDILGEIQSVLRDSVIYQSNGHLDQCLQLVDDLAQLATEPVLSLKDQAVSQKATDNILGKRGLETGTSLKEGPSFKLSASRDEAKAEEFSTSYGVIRDDKIIFPAVGSTIRELLRLSKLHLYIVIDEWSSIPTELQPFLAEFLKRAFLPTAEITVKIASLEYRTQFNLRKGAEILGIEVGSDMATALDIDDYYVYDRNPEQVSANFADILYLHILSELKDDYLRSEYKISSSDDFINLAFTDRSSFAEVVRASEGVARDLINIFSQAYFTPQAKQRGKIEKKPVMDAARQWFEQDKEKNLDEQLTTALRRIVQEVIGKRRARSFLIPRELERHPIIQRLFDARVLHLVRRGYADKDNPGVRYNIYTLDYGTYVDLMNTLKQPQLDFEVMKNGVSEDFVVPFDDKRSIRRIILSKAILDEITPEA